MTEGVRTLFELELPSCKGLFWDTGETSGLRMVHEQVTKLAIVCLGLEASSSKGLLWDCVTGGSLLSWTKFGDKSRRLSLWATFLQGLCLRHW